MYGSDVVNHRLLARIAMVHFMDTRLQPNNQLLDRLRNQRRSVFNDERREGQDT
jgi:hypothetical protein